MQRLIAILVLMLSLPMTSFANGQRDLDDGIAFYENLDTDRAIERLIKAGNATDLDAKNKGKAWMYVGVIHFELGDRDEAKKAWSKCFSIDSQAKAPDGISPKMVEAITMARMNSKSNPTPNIDSKKDADPKEGGVTKPKDDPKKDKLPGVEPKPADPDESSGLTSIFGPDFDWVLWGSVGGGVAVAAIVTVVVIALNSNSNECQQEGGGCVLITYK